MSTTTNSQPPSIAVALIVKNEERNLELCLETVKEWADEIIIVDSGSTDNTEAVARRFNATFRVNDQWPGFGKQRQLAQSLITSDFVFWLDADERVTPELAQSIGQAVRDNLPDTIYSINRLSWVFGRFIKHSGWFPDRVIRLYPTKATGYDDALVHEKVKTPPHLRIQPLEGLLQHYTYENIHHYLVKSAGYAKAWADGKQSRGKSASLLQAFGHGLACFLKMYVFKAGFLDGKQGFLLALLSAHSTYVKYADLWVRTKTAQPKD